MDFHTAVSVMLKGENMTQKETLIPITQKQAIFYGEEITVAIVLEGTRKTIYGSKVNPA